MERKDKDQFKLSPTYCARPNIFVEEFVIFTLDNLWRSSMITISYACGKFLRPNPRKQLRKMKLKGLRRSRNKLTTPANLFTRHSVSSATNANAESVSWNSSSIYMVNGVMLVNMLGLSSINIRITFAFTLDNSKAIGAHACSLM